MKQVKIAEFKSKLSSHLREVKRGKEIVILDRDHPVAKVIPFTDMGEGLVIREATDKRGFKNLNFKGIKARVDVVKLLREDRDRR
jgi:antitoxin (DNA-binding transcriptional repressor) of toxin-antitoxin stability system